MRNFRDYPVYIKSLNVVGRIYNLAANLPAHERYGLSSQITRCAVSIPSNLAEGSAKSSNKDFVRFLEISLGSSYELETQLVITQDIYYKPKSDISVQKLKPLIDDTIEIQKMLFGLIKKIKNDN